MKREDVLDSRASALVLLEHVFPTPVFYQNFSTDDLNKNQENLGESTLFQGFLSENMWLISVLRVLLDGSCIYAHALLIILPKRKKNEL